MMTNLEYKLNIRYSNIIPSYITIDTNVILSLFKSKGKSQMNKKVKLLKEW